MADTPTGLKPIQEKAVQLDAATLLEQSQQADTQAAQQKYRSLLVTVDKIERTARALKRFLVQHNVKDVLPVCTSCNRQVYPVDMGTGDLCVACTISALADSVPALATS